jgi:hypothetical protein
MISLSKSLLSGNKWRCSSGSGRGRHCVRRLFWIMLRPLWSGWKDVLLIVKPDTVVAWHWAGFRWYWRWKSRRLP